MNNQTKQPIAFNKKFRIFGISPKGGKLQTIRIASGWHDDIYDDNFDTEDDAIEFMKMKEYSYPFVVVPIFIRDYFPDQD